MKLEGQPSLSDVIIFMLHKFFKCFNKVLFLVPPPHKINFSGLTSKKLLELAISFEDKKTRLERISIFL